MKSYMPTILLGCLAMINAVAQSDRVTDRQVEQIADELFALQDLDLDYSELYENLLQLRSNPLDINTATSEQLRSLFILSESQISGVLDYRNKAGPLMSIYELQNVDAMDAATLSRLEPFITVSDRTLSEKKLLTRIATPGNGYVVLRYQRTVELKKGFRESNGAPAPYAGSPENLYMRFRSSRANDYSIGLTAEKDAGEAITWSPQHKSYGADFYSYHVQLMNKGRLKNLVLGDFQAQFGQGLLLGGAFGVGKGGETITTTRRSNLGFLPYTSINENNFFRGMAATYQVSRHWRVSAFASRKFSDGAAQRDSVGNVIEISSLSQTGLHRTANELTNRKSTEETGAGMVLGYERNSLSWGAILHYAHFSVPINIKPTLYNQFYFRGPDALNTSTYLNYGWRNFSFFSEAARSAENGYGGIAGLLASLSPAMDVSIVYRNFARNFQSYYGNAFGEGSSPQNESGFYLGWKYKIEKRHLLAGYTDLFRFHWLRYRVYAPSDGHEWLARYTFQPSKLIVFYVQVREEQKARNISESKIYQTAVGQKRNYWANLDYAVSDQLAFKTRIQKSTYTLDGNVTRGFALVQDVTLSNKKLSLSARYALFDTDDYDNRQYVYERDVWLAYSIPAYYGVGVRTYLLLRYRFTSRLDGWFRWARTTLQNQEAIGSGNETIDGNQRNDIKFQVRFNF